MKNKKQTKKITEIIKKRKKKKECKHAKKAVVSFESGEIQKFGVVTNLGKHKRTCCLNCGMMGGIYNENNNKATDVVAFIPSDKNWLKELKKIKQ